MPRVGFVLEQSKECAESAWFLKNIEKTIGCPGGGEPRGGFPLDRGGLIGFALNSKGWAGKGGFKGHFGAVPV